MLSLFHWLEFVHILTAIVALGASAGLGIILELYADDPAHGAFILRMIASLLTWLVLPGYGLMLATGLAMVGAAELWSAQWVRTAIILWCVGLALLLADRAVLVRQMGELARDGRASVRYRRLSLAGRTVGAAAGLVVAAIVYVMVLKPQVDWLPW